MMVRFFVVAAFSAGSLLVASAPVSASKARTAQAKHAWQKPKPRRVRDCTPVNGRYGYYGNPWCDTGSSRPPDIDFRENHRGRGW
jgi:hypothetical protein